MFVRTHACRVLLCTLTLAAGLAAAGAAQAQLGSVNNPPPQNLFETRPIPKLRDGLGTSAERPRPPPRPLPRRVRRHDHRPATRTLR